MAVPKGTVSLFYTYTKIYYTTCASFSVEEM